MRSVVTQAGSKNARRRYRSGISAGGVLGIKCADSSFGQIEKNAFANADSRRDESPETKKSCNLGENNRSNSHHLGTILADTPSAHSTLDVSAKDFGQRGLELALFDREQTLLGRSTKQTGQGFGVATTGNRGSFLQPSSGRCWRAAAS